MITPLFRKVDCLQIPVPDLESGLASYRDRLGHELIWRTEAAVPRMPDSDAEIVSQTERPEMEIDLPGRPAQSGRDAAGHPGFPRVRWSMTFHLAMEYTP